MSTDQKNVDEMTYEEAIAELEATIHNLELEQSTLEEAIALFERGQALANRCAALLEQAELRIRMLGANDQPALDQQEEV